VTHVVDLGSDVRALLFTYPPSQSGRPRGFVLDHPTPDGSRCGGTVVWDRDGMGDGPTWRLVTLDPLEVEPSIRCHCGYHGHVREGRWSVDG
jgi:hypothetical protein